MQPGNTCEFLRRGTLFAWGTGARGAGRGTARAAGSAPAARRAPGRLHEPLQPAGLGERVDRAPVGADAVVAAEAALPALAGLDPALVGRDEAEQVLHQVRALRGRGERGAVVLERRVVGPVDHLAAAGAAHDEPGVGDPDLRAVPIALEDALLHGR